MTRVTVANPECVVRRAFWLAWQACGSPFGMGVLQNNPTATEDQVWANVRTAGDYGSAGMISHPDRPGEAYGDYVFGRMMKLRIKWDKTSVEYRDDTPRSDYQAWCHKYPSYRELVEAAIASLQEKPA